MNILNLLKGVLSLFIENFPAFIGRLFAKIPKDLKTQLIVIVDVVNGLKQFVDSPLADVITGIIPGTADDELKSWLRRILPKVLVELGALKNGIISIPKQNSLARGPVLRGISDTLAAELTGMDPDQAALTMRVMYKGDA